MTSKVTLLTLIMSASSVVFLAPRAAIAVTALDNEPDLVSMTATVHDYMLPDDWVSYAGKKYLFVMDAARGRDLNRDDALLACQSIEAELVSIETEEEFELMKKEIRQRVVAAGQEFAHERWWTAGRSIGNRWIWDRQNSPPVTVSALKRKNVPPDGQEYYLALSHGYDQQGWRLRPVPSNYELRYICQKDSERKIDEGNLYENGGITVHHLYNHLSKTRGIAPMRDSDQGTVSILATSLRISSLEASGVNVHNMSKWMIFTAPHARNRYYEMTRAAAEAITTLQKMLMQLAVTADEGTELYSSLIVTKRFMTEFSNVQAIVRYNGAARVEFTEELCTFCESQPSLFPFDQMHCSIQMALGSSTRRRLVTPSTGKFPQLEMHAVSSWMMDSCKHLTKRKLPCNAGIDDITSGSDQMLAEDGNASWPNIPMLSAPHSIAPADCIRYDFCFRRILVYYAVVLLVPISVITVLVLVLLMTSPPASVKLPATMAAITICCMVMQFCCSLMATRTLPVIVIYPIGLIAISLTSACVSLVLNRRDSFPLLHYRSFNVDDPSNRDPEVSIGRYSFSKNDNGNHKPLCWRPVNHRQGSISGSGSTPTMGSSGRHQQDNLKSDFCSAPKSISNAVGNCVGGVGYGSELPQSLTAGARQTGKYNKAVTIPTIILPPPPHAPEPLTSSTDRQFRRRRCVGGGFAASQQQQQQQLERQRDANFRINEHDNNIADFDKKLEEDEDMHVVDREIVGNNQHAGSQSLNQRIPSSHSHSMPDSASPSPPAAVQSFPDPLTADFRSSNNVDTAKMASAISESGRHSSKRKSPSSYWSSSSSSSKRGDRLIKRARIEKYVDMTLFVATIVLFLASVVATIVVAF